LTDIVTLADVRAHLRYPASDTLDDVAIQGFISAADEVIIREVGHVIPKMYSETYDGGDTTICLANVPIISVQEVQEGWGFTNYELAQVQVNTIPAPNMFSYSIDVPATGEITRRSAGNVAIPFMPGDSNIAVTYTAGRKTIPANIRLAALELIAHWWQNSQQRTAGGSQNEYSYDSMNVDFTRTTGMSAINQGVPYRILELLKPHRRQPIIG
jgi:hypothetical protein